jgi:hypothetical protein
VTDLEPSFSPESLAVPPRRVLARALVIFSFLAATALMLIGAGALAGAYLRSRDMPDGFGWVAPMAQVSNRDLVPASALLPLTDLAAEDALDQTLEGTDLESAFAIIAYDPRLSDPSRVGALLQIGTRYSESKNWRRAAWTFQTAALLAILSPALSDSARVDTLLAAGTDLRDTDAKEAARRVIDQAYLITMYSPALRKQVRSNRLNQIATAYDSLNLPGIGDQARSKAQDVSAAPDIPPAIVRAPFIPIPGQLPSSLDLDQARSRREQAAAQLLDDVSATSPKSQADWPRDSSDQLKQALIEEDMAHDDYYAQQIPLAKDPSVQIALAAHKVNWLALKYRIAKGAFGTTIVSDWTKSTNDIADQLSDAWDDLFQLYQSQADLQGNPSDVNQATEDVLEQRLIAVRWGWSQKSEGELRDSLTEVTEKLRDASVPTLRIDATTRSGKTLYLLLPDELYGEGAQVFPQ